MTGGARAWMQRCPFHQPTPGSDIGEGKLDQLSPGMVVIPHTVKERVKPVEARAFLRPLVGQTVPTVFPPRTVAVNGVANGGMPLYFDNATAFKSDVSNNPPDVSPQPPVHGRGARGPLGT